MDNKTNGEKKFQKCSYIQALQNILKIWFLTAKCPRIIPQKHQSQDSQSMNLHRNQYSLPLQSQKNSITSSISDKLYKNSQNCELWKITRRHKKKYLKLILIICSHTVSSSTCFLKKNYSKIVKVFLHVETNQYNRDSKFILCNPSIQSLGSPEAKKKLHKLELSE